MSRRSLFFSTLLAGSLMLPLAASAQPYCWGPNDDYDKAITEAMKGASLDLNAAITAATKKVPGAVQGARLAAFGLPGEERVTPKDRKGSAPTYLVTVRDADTRTMVAVNGLTGATDVIGEATGVFARAPFNPSSGWRHQGGWKGWGARGFGPAADMRTAKVDAATALGTAANTVKDAKPVMVRGVASDESTEGTAWMVTMKSTAESGPRSMSIVLVDSVTGKVLATESFEPGRFGPRMGGMPRGGMPGMMGPGRGGPMQGGPMQGGPAASPAAPKAE
ncbi:hypothetical protein IHV25_06330 [Phaeovibrio sulfidiphilus]|uniref:PepSY domain-containing protein n=1 Tax=Phaeovibrio sulfidiphilus TaxID=1220600 RepID=A0A8J7CQU8_9PROT|nr:hypothetical protein [Phaeovibrio sulfidiphilus]MBE1237260.1 hypothetical protein [Phaeovibrio sulfidiphilus]